MGDKERRDQNENMNEHLRKGERGTPQSDRIKRELIDEADRQARPDDKK